MNTNQWKEQFKQLPFEKKEAIFNLLSEKVEKAENNNGAKIDRIEKSLVRFLTKTWNDEATKAINKALKTFTSSDKRFSKKDADKVINSLSKSFSGIEKKTKKRVEKDMEEIYKTNKNRFQGQFKVDKSEKVVIYKGQRFDPLKKQVVNHNRIIHQLQWSDDLVTRFEKAEFGINDSYAYENLARLENVAIGDHFDKTLKPSVTKKIQEGLLDKGMNRADASAFLQAELTKTLGGNIAGALPASIAAGQASVTAYFSGLTATNVTFARNFSQIQLMDEVGITQLVFMAIIDNLTSQICNQMDGRVFTIEQAITHRDKVLEADDVTTLKEIAPFTRNLSAFNLSAGQDLTSPEVQDKLAKAGVICPPLHFRCRSELQPA